MKPQEFWKRVDKMMEYSRTDGDGVYDKSGVGFFISGMETIIEELKEEEEKPDKKED